MMRHARTPFFAFALALGSLTSVSLASAQPLVPDPPPTSTSGSDLVRPADPSLPPTSTSGTDLGVRSEPPAAPPQTAPLVPAETATATRDVEAARLESLEQRVARDEQHIRKLEDRIRFFKNLKLESFIQPQLLVQSFNAAASPNAQNGQLPPGIQPNDITARADGTTTNGTFFRVRRARMRTFYETEVMRLFLQIDALPSGGIGPGIGTIMRNAEATGIARWTPDVRTEFTAGLFFTPFRKELLEASLFRPFIERTWFVQNAFPTERDYGLHLKTIALGERLVVDVAVVNGQRLGERTFVALPDLNRSKDGILYVTYKVGFVTLGASGYLGNGQVVDPQALRFKQFSKWAVNYQAAAEYRLVRALGESRLWAELAITQNMDTGVLYPFATPRIPNIFSDEVANLDGRALYVRFEQDIGRHLVAAYRYDMYTPNSALANNARDTHAFLLVGKISPNLRWMNELDWAIDNVHPAGTPAPSKQILAFSSVLQAMF